MARIILYTNSPGPVLTTVITDANGNVVNLTGKEVWLMFREEYTATNAFKKIGSIISAAAGSVSFTPVLTDWGDEPAGVYDLQWAVHTAGGAVEQHVDAGQAELRTGF